MKVIVYTLNPDGTVPEYVVDGGYLPVSNLNKSPQDLDLIGIALDSAEQPGFNDMQSLINYTKDNNIIDRDHKTNEITEPEVTVQYIWDRMENIIS